MAPTTSANKPIREAWNIERCVSAAAAVAVVVLETAVRQSITVIIPIIAISASVSGLLWD
jgi:hypothetical protein